MGAEAKEHCCLCGETHAGQCSPDSFVYFECEKCSDLERLPWDAMAFCGLGGLFCGCGNPAEKCWNQITHEEYLAKDGN